MRCVIKSQSGLYYVGDEGFKLFGMQVRRFGKRKAAVVFPTKKDADEIAKTMNNILIEKA